MKEKELNKYQKALKEVEVQCEFNNLGEQSYNLLKELVDKETPKKPIIRKETEDEVGEYKVTLCCNCENVLTDEAGYYNDYYDVEYCPFCGQHLDWSK